MTIKTAALPGGARDLAVATAREAGAILRDRLGQARSIEFKGAVDLVTDADRASERLIGERLRAAFPDHRIVGEEGIASQAGGQTSTGFVWVVDPLDGTTNYAHGYPHFAVSIGLVHGDDVVLGVVYDPMRDELFEAVAGEGTRLNGAPMRVSTVDAPIRSLLATGFSYDLDERAAQLALWSELQSQVQGIRRDGAAALNLCYVAAGRLEGFWERPLQPWDMAAGSLIVTEAGGRVSALDGGPFRPFAREIVAGNGPLHGRLVEIIVGASARAAAT